jgi:hypothetical protein
MKTEKGQQLRKAKRVDLRCSLGFTSDEIEGQAKVTNISPRRLPGRIRHQPGREIGISRLLHLPNQPTPVKWTEPRSGGSPAMPSD